MDLQEIEAQIKEIEAQISSLVFKKNALLKLKEGIKNKEKKVTQKIGGRYGN
jgi:prefoldin subunit 5